MSISPYQPPVEELPAQRANRESAMNSHPLLPFAQLGLRLLGVMLVVDGLGAILGGLVQGLVQGRAYAAEGYGFIVDPHSAGWAAGGIPYLIIGGYLVVGGNWILQNVFLPSQHPTSNDAVASLVEDGEPDDARAYWKWFDD